MVAADNLVEDSRNYADSTYERIDTYRGEDTDSNIIHLDSPDLHEALRSSSEYYTVSTSL